MPPEEFVKSSILEGPHTRLTPSRYVPYLPMPVSGLYVRRTLSPFSPGGRLSSAIIETLRLDVDGWYPQQAASGSYAYTLFSIRGPVVWYAYPLTEVAPGVWEGSIVRAWDVAGKVVPFKFSKVRIDAPYSGIAALAPKLTVTFSEGALPETRTL